MPRLNLHSLHDSIVSALTPRYGAAEARAIARMVLEVRCGATMTDILLGRDTERWDTTLLDRLVTGEPVQYVLGEATFCGLRIGVAPGVLIPRPETEWLVEHLPESVSGNGTMRVLDVCTGSGCIALALKHRFPSAHVEAWDISPEALKIAQQNFVCHGADVLTREVDLLCDTAWQNTSQEGYDAIVSNPPYICDSERVDMDTHVLDYEPALALFVPDEDPLLFYRALGRLARGRLRVGGCLMVECNVAYVDEVAALFGSMGFSAVERHRDCYDKYRFVTARR